MNSGNPRFQLEEKISNIEHRTSNIQHSTFNIQHLITKA